MQPREAERQGARKVLKGPDPRFPRPSRALPRATARSRSVSRGPPGPQDGPSGPQEAPQDGPRGPRNDPRALKDAEDDPKTAPEAAKTPQEASKRPQKRAPKGENHSCYYGSCKVSGFLCFRLPDISRRPRTPPIAPQDSPRGPKDRPHTAQETPRTAQEAPKTAPRGVPDGGPEQKCRTLGPKKPPRGPKKPP